MAPEFLQQDDKQPHVHEKNDFEAARGAAAAFQNEIKDAGRIMDPGFYKGA